MIVLIVLQPMRAASRDSIADLGYILWHYLREFISVRRLIFR
jgi:hypothetical protein